MTTTVELERAGTFEAIQYGTFEIQNGTSDGRLAPEARITTANSVPVESNQRVRIVIDGVTRFEGRTTSEGTRRGNGQRVVKCEHEAYRVFDEAVSVGPSNDTAFILSNAIGETSFGSFTVDYTGTSDILGGTYEAENRKVKQIFRDIADRVNRVFWVATDGTITVQPRGGRGEWTSVSLPGDRASIDEYEAGDVRSVINDVTVVGTREEKVEGSAVDSASISEYGRRSERYNLAYVTTTAEANDAAEQLLQPEPLDSAKLTVGSNVGTNPEQNLANYSITLTDPSLDLSSDTFLIESQTIEQGRVTLEVGEASRNSARSVNRKAKSNGDVTDLGNVVGSGQLGDQSVDTPQLVDTAVIEQKLADASVGSGKLVDASVIEQKLADASVGSGKLVDESVIEQKLADAAVTSAKLVNGSVLEQKLDDLSVSETKIQDNSISTPKVQADAITASEIFANTITAAEIASDTITANEINVNTITAGEIASRTITALEIDVGTITSNEIDTQTIVADNIATRTIDALRIESDAITANEIAADTITADEITSRTISALEIESGTITANEIDANTITAGEIVSGTITALQIASGTITANQIDSDTITAREIAGDTITGDEIAANSIQANEIDSLVLDTDQLKIGFDTNTEIEFTENSLGDTAMRPEFDERGYIGDQFHRFDVGYFSTIDSIAVGTDNLTINPEGADNTGDFDLLSDEANITSVKAEGGASLRPTVDNAGALGTLQGAWAAVVTHNLNELTPAPMDPDDPIDGVDLDELKASSWDKPPAYVAQRKATAADDRDYIRQNPKTSGVELGHMTNYLLETCKAQQETIDDLESRIEQLEAAVGPNA